MLIEISELDLEIVANCLERLKQSHECGYCENAAHYTFEALRSTEKWGQELKEASARHWAKINSQKEADARPRVDRALDDISNVSESDSIAVAIVHASSIIAEALKGK